jgi:hypothetical protein
MGWPARATAAILFALAVLVPAVGFAQTANIGNFVWMDSNRNGLQDAGEPGLPDVTVQLWNGAMNSLIASATTNAGGNYTLVGPTGVALRVRAILPDATLRFSPKDQGANDLVDSDVNDTVAPVGFTDAFTLPTNVVSITSIDVGMMTPQQATLGDFVWDDFDEDGVQDAGEPGLAGITVQLWNSGMSMLIEATTTSGQGNYQLTTPEPGSYRIRVVAPAGYLFSPKDVGGNDLLDSDTNPAAPIGFTDVEVIASNVVAVTRIDSGIHPPRVFRNGFD